MFADAEGGQWLWRRGSGTSGAGRGLSGGRWSWWPLLIKPEALRVGQNSSSYSQESPAPAVPERVTSLLSVVCLWLFFTAGPAPHLLPCLLQAPQRGCPVSAVTACSSGCWVRSVEPTPRADPVSSSGTVPPPCPRWWSLGVWLWRLLSRLWLTPCTHCRLSSSRAGLCGTVNYV